MHIFVVLLPLWFAVGGAVAAAVTGALSRGTGSVGRVVGHVQLGFILTAIAVLWWGSDAATGLITWWKFEWSTLLWCVLGAAVGWLCMAWEIGVARVLALIIPRGRDWQALAEGNTPALASLDAHRPGWLVLGVGFAVGEEVLWRGLAFNVLDGAGWPELNTVVLLAALFGLCHAWFGLRGVLAKTGEGLAWAGLALAAGTVLPAVVSHVAFQVLVLRRLGRQRARSRPVAATVSGDAGDSDDIGDYPGAPARGSPSGGRQR